MLDLLQANQQADQVAIRAQRAARLAQRADDTHLPIAQSMRVPGGHAAIAGDAEQLLLVHLLSPGRGRNARRPDSVLKTGDWHDTKRPTLDTAKDITNWRTAAKP
ncbi:hypothetical protein GCM10027321_43010 [Massilia terrae]